MNTQFRMSHNSEHLLGFRNLQYEYIGIFNEILIDAILFNVKNSISQVEKNTTRKKRVFHICVELLQNLQRYIEKGTFTDENGTEIDTSFGSFHLKNYQKHYQINTQNYVPSSKSIKLKSYLDTLSQLDIQALNQLYNNVLLDKSFNEKGGASLGFIDIYRKTQNQISFQLTDLSNGFHLFTINAKILKPTTHAIPPTS